MVMVDDRVSDHDEVELFGHNQSVEAYALKRDTINYEVLTLLTTNTTSIQVKKADYSAFKFKS